MNTDDFRKLLDKSLKPIKTDLNVVKKDLGELKKSHYELKNTVDDLKNNVGNLKYTVDGLKNSVSELKDTVDKKVLPSVTYIETNIKAYKDAYQNNNANARKLEKRVEVLEDNANIVPPSELILAEVS